MFEESDNDNNTTTDIDEVVTHLCYENGSLVEPIQPIEGVDLTITHASEVSLLIPCSCWLSTSHLIELKVPHKVNVPIIRSDHICDSYIKVRPEQSNSFNRMSLY